MMEWQPLENGEYDLGDGNILDLMGNEEGEGCPVIEFHYANGKHESVQLDLFMTICHLVPAAPAVPPDIAETIRGALLGHRATLVDARQLYGRETYDYYNKIIVELDAALVWLDAQDTRGEGDGSPR